jgi:hypothetical protein
VLQTLETLRRVTNKPGAASHSSKAKCLYVRFIFKLRLLSVLLERKLALGPMIRLFKYFCQKIMENIGALLKLQLVFAKILS